MFADTEALISDGENPPFNADRTRFNADPTLDDLVDEILRRGVESDLPDLSEEEEHSEVPEPFVFEEPPSEPPVEEPPVEDPPVDEPVTDEPPADEPPLYEPPVDEPPADEPPGEEPPPMWMRAAIERVARSRDDRPAAPAPRRAEHLGPVFELHDEPEREREAETSTLSDIAQELGLTIPVAVTTSGARVAPVEAEVEEAGPEAHAAELETDDNTGWDTDIRKTLFAAAPDPEPPPPPLPPAAPPVFVAPPVVLAPPVFVEPIEAPEVFTPLPSQVAPELTPSYAAPPPAAVIEPPAPAPDAVPRRSLADRTADIRESSGRFLKIAATLVLVVGGIAAAAFGGWRYYASLSTPGTLVVESTPPGAQVEIDGNQHGTTPVTLDLAPGTHNLALTRRGMTRRFEVAVRAGEQTTKTLDWTQVREIGSLAVTTDPPGAKVSVDGRAVGVSPLTIPDLPAGKHRVVLESQGGAVRRDVTIEADRTATLSEAIFSGFLAVFAPVELQIYEGNRLLGTTENSRIMIPAGRHELTLLNRELGSRLSRTVEVEPGQVAAINITEVPATAKPAANPDPSPQN